MVAANCSRQLRCPRARTRANTSRNCRETLHKWPLLACAYGEFQNAAFACAGEREADNVCICNRAHTRWCDSDAETNGNETKDCHPVGCFLDDPGAEAVCGAERKRLVVGENASRARIKDERLITKLVWANRLLNCYWVRSR